MALECSADEPTARSTPARPTSSSKLFGETQRLWPDHRDRSRTRVRAASCASRVLFLRDGEVSLELKRGKDTDSQFYQRITDALTQQQTGGECA